MQKKGWNIAKEFQANGEKSKEEAMLMRRLVDSYIDVDREKRLMDVDE